MFLASINEFSLIIPSTATRPSAAWGVAVTPAQNAYGTYAQLLAGAAVTEDCYEIEIEVNTVASSTIARDCIVTIGFDPAGGTSYTDKIVDLVCGPAAAHGATGASGSFFRFPLFVKAGTSIGAKASVNSATLTAIRVACVLRGRPSHPELIRAGSFVTTFGSTPATSSGTAITPGTTSDGALVQLGAALTTPIWFWEIGVGVNNATMSTVTYHADLVIGDVTNQRTVILDAPIYTGSAESLSKGLAGRYANAAIGDLVSGRAQCSATPDTGVSMAAYGVGG